jgi:heat shock protein HtpX
VVAGFAAALALVGALVLAALGLLVGLGWWAPALVGAIAGAVAGRLIVQRGADRIIPAVGAAPLTDAPRLENLVDGLCVTNGIAHPRLYVIETPTINACAVGSDPRHSSLIVTRGALDGFTRIELEAVVARELALVKRGHAALASVVAAIASIWPGASPRLLPERSDVLADLEAVRFTRYPPGLIQALDKVRAAPAVSGAPHWTHHLWVESPDGSDADGSGTFHSPIDERIATLREL